MASTAQLLTPETINADPWGALKVAVYDNPAQLSASIQSVIGQPVPSDGPQLFAFIQKYFNENGNIDPFITAAQNVAIASPSTMGKSTGFSWGGLLGGIFTGIGSALSGNGANQSSAAQAALIAQQQAEAQRRTTTTILIVVGIVIAAIVAIVIFRKK